MLKALLIERFALKTHTGHKEVNVYGFNPGEIDALLALDDDEKADTAPPLPESPVSRPGDLWLPGASSCSVRDASRAEAVARLLGDSLRQTTHECPHRVPSSLSSVGLPKIRPFWS
jgi:uncharacterized protein (TIGR03435 family)